MQKKTAEKQEKCGLSSRYRWFCNGDCRNPMRNEVLFFILVFVIIVNNIYYMGE